MNTVIVVEVDVSGFYFGCFFTAPFFILAFFLKLDIMKKVRKEGYTKHSARLYITTKKGRCMCSIVKLKFAA